MRIYNIRNYYICILRNRCQSQHMRLKMLNYTRIYKYPFRLFTSSNSSSIICKLLQSPIFAVYMFCALIAYIGLPLLPIVLNTIQPLDEPRPPIFILGGELFIDRFDYYWEIFLFDLISCIVSTCIISAVDSMYVAVIEHCLGLFAVIR